MAQDRKKDMKNPLDKSRHDQSDQRGMDRSGNKDQNVSDENTGRRDSMDDMNRNSGQQRGRDTGRGSEESL